jgi:transposase
VHSSLHFGLDGLVQKRSRAVAQDLGQRDRPDLLQLVPVSRAQLDRTLLQQDQCRRVATRYDKLATNYLAFVKLASIRIWLRANESTA